MPILEDNLPLAWSTPEELDALVISVVNGLDIQPPATIRSDDEIVSDKMIPDLRELLEAFIAATDGLEGLADGLPSLSLMGCRVLNCQCIGMELKCNLYFESVIFNESVSFSNTIIRGDVLFDTVLFAEKCGFQKSQFLGEASFCSSVFKDKASFSGAVFASQTSFHKSQFVSEAIFWNTTVSDAVRFRDVVFHDTAVFGLQAFVGFIDFSYAEIVKRIVIGGISREGGPIDSTGQIRFQEMRLRPGAEFVFHKSNLERRESHREMMSRWNESPKMIHWLFQYFYVLLTAWPIGFKQVVEYLGFEPRGNLVFYEKNQIADQKDCQELEIAALDYLWLRDFYRVQPSCEAQEDICTRKYFDLKRRSAIPQEYPTRVIQQVKIFLDWFVLRNCLGYMVQPWRIAITGGCVMVLSTVIYAAGASESRVAFNGSLEDGATALSLWNESVFTPLYFSMTTFVTLGYGDFAPTGWFKLVTGIEALLGVMLLSLFTVAWARKMVR